MKNNETDIGTELSMFDIEQCTLPLIVAIGVCFNGLCMFVVARSKLKTSSTFRYLFAKCGADSGYLTALLVFWTNQFCPLLTIPGVCQLFYWLSGTMGYLSTWYTVWMALARAIELHQQRLKKLKWLQKWATVVIIGHFSVALVTFFNISIIVGVSTSNNNVTMECSPLRTYANVYRTLSRLDTVLNVLLPDVCLGLILALLLCDIIRRSTPLARLVHHGIILHLTFYLLLCSAGHVMRIQVMLQDFIYQNVSACSLQQQNIARYIGYLSYVVCPLMWLSVPKVSVRIKELLHI